MTYPKPAPRVPKVRQPIARSKRPRFSNAYTRPEWLRLVRQVRKRSKGLCEQCGREPVSGQPHHRSYQVGVRGPGRLLVPLDQLIDLCRRCHLGEHRSER